MPVEPIYITINHLDLYGDYTHFKVGQTLTLKKDLCNPYDDEAIVVYNQYQSKCGYVANSVHTTARGTYSAGRLYSYFDQEITCSICFITEEILIARIVPIEKEEIDKVQN